MNMGFSQDQTSMEAIKHALKSLRKRHMREEVAHGPAVTALSKPSSYQDSEWKDKAEMLELELQQCYKAQSRLSDQLVVEVAETRDSKASIQEKEALITDLQDNVNQSRDECSHLAFLVEEKKKAVELLISENQELDAELKRTNNKAKEAEAENKMLIDRWMLHKMQEAEQLNEANAVYEDMMNRVRACSLGELDLQQAESVIRRIEDGAKYREPTIPSENQHNITAHKSSCASVIFEYNSSLLVSGARDQTVKIWDTRTGLLHRTLGRCSGSVLDLTITHDNQFIIAACSSNNLYAWDADTCQLRHTLTGHKETVSAVDASRISSRHVASASFDRTIKIWDLQRGYCSSTIICHSNCNSLCFGKDAMTICSGHTDGNIRLWDAQNGKLVNEVNAHSSAVTSVSLSSDGNTILTSGKDNVQTLLDVRSLEVYGTFRVNGNRTTTNSSRSCISPDNNFVASGSSDGSVYIWSVLKGSMVSTLKKHEASVMCCSWSDTGRPLASSDKNGVICTWK